MNHGYLLSLFGISLATLLPALVSHNLNVLLAVCACDVIIFFTVMAQSTGRNGVNLLSPAFWAVAGYLLYGQVPILLSFVVVPEQYIPYSSTTAMVGLVLAGYRAALAGIVVFNSPRFRLRVLQGPLLPRISMFYPILLVVAGGAARLLIRNNVSGPSVADWAWYYSVPFAATPAGLCLALGEVGRQRLAFGRVRSVGAFWFIVAFASLQAVIDVSRKDTGAILFPILMYVCFGASSARRIAPISLRLTGWLMAVGVGLGCVLMATRAYSWSRANNTEFQEELKTSFKERLANDVTAPLAFVMSTTPDVYPYLNGLTLGSLLPIPRTWFPTRPPAHSYFVGLQYKGIASTQYEERYMGTNQLSVSAHMLGEGYANFGYFGAIAFEMVFGITVGWLEQLLTAGRGFLLRILSPTIMFFILTQQRGDLAMMNGGWLLSAGLLGAVLVATTVLSPDGAFRYPQCWSWLVPTRTRDRRIAPVCKTEAENACEL